MDALQVINALNDNRTVPYVLSEGQQLAAEQSITITVGQAAGTRTYRLEVTPTFAASATPSSSQDLFAIYLVDPQQPSQTLLDRGTPGTTLFSLSATGAEFAPGRVRWDGEVVEIDLSAVTDRDTAELRLQLLNGNGDGASRVTVKPLSNDVNAEGIASPVLLDTATPSAAGAAFALTGVPAANDVDVRVENARYNSATKHYAAGLRLQNQGNSLGRSVAVAFPGLPSGVTLRNPSGTTSGGAPYINFAPAISRGGLSKNSRSERLLVEFDNPDGALFTLTPQVFAAANQPPTLAAIGPLTVRPGDKLTTPLVAADPDGDTITFSLGNTGGASGTPGGTGFASALPTGILRANGTLEFTPTPAQIGTYTFDAIASDGVLEARRTITLNVVADPLTTTRVSGKVLQVNGQPLAGMQVEIGAVQGLTMADGSFTLDLGSGPLVSNTIKIRGELFPGLLAYPFIAEKLPLVLEHDVFARVNNVIGRPIYLPALDVAGGTTIDPMRDTMVQQEIAPGEMAEVMVAAGTLMNQQGTPFTGTLSITEVPPNLTPAALPEGMLPDLVVTIQPGEMVFSTPAPLTLPNRSGYLPGTDMDLWSISPVTGEFEVVGLGRVSSDGSVVETIEGGIRNSNWHAFILKLINTIVNLASSGCKDEKLSCTVNSAVDLNSGAVTESHRVFSYNSLGTSRNLNLTYDSLRAAPQPIVGFTSSFECVFADTGGATASQRFAAELVISGLGTEFSTGQRFFSVPSCTSGESLSITGSLQADFGSFPSGQYDISLKAGLLTRIGSSGTPSGSIGSTSSSISSVNYQRSSVGSGWGIQGIQQIFENRDGSVLLVDGGGGQLHFTPPSAANQPYVSPRGDFSSLVKLADGTFRRTLKDQNVYQFDPDDRLASMTDRNGNVTQYQYEGGLLKRIIDPVNLSTFFNYSAGMLFQIIDPFGRITRLDHDTAGNLLQIVNPDGATTAWEYDSQHHAVAMTDPRGNRGVDNYNAAGRATDVVFPDGTTAQVAPLLTQGLEISAGNTSWETAAKPAINAKYAGPNGNLLSATLDPLGQPEVISDSLGPISSVIRNDQNLVVRSFDARGYLTSFEYDERGNVIRLIDTISDKHLDGDIYWTGGLVGSWNDPANWSTNRIPDAADRVVIDVPNQSVHVTIPSGDVVVKSLYSTEDMTIAGGSLTVTGDSSILGRLQVSAGASLGAVGAEAVFRAEGATQVTDGALIADQGGRISLPNVDSIRGSRIELSRLGEMELPNVVVIDEVTFDIRDGSKLSLTKPTEYDGGADGFVFSIGWNISGAGSELEFPNLTSWVGRAGLSATLDVTVASGGTLSMPQLTSMPNRTINVNISGSGSRVLLPELTTIEATGAFSLDALGELVVPKLDTFLHHGFILDGATMSLPQVTDIRGSSIQLLHGGVVDFSNVVQIDEASFDIRDGSKLTFPSVTEYDGGAEGFVFPLAWNISGAASELAFPNLSTWIGRSGLSAVLGVTVADGGTLSTPKLTSIPDRTLHITVTGEDSVWTAPELQQITARGTLRVENLGTIDLPKLSMMRDHSISVANAVVSLELLTEITTSTLEVELGMLELSPAVTTVLTRSEVNLVNGGVIVGSGLSLDGGSVLTGIGVIRGHVESAGVIRPGSDQVGAITIDGDFLQTTDGRLDVQVNSNVSFDVLEVLGTAQLAGLLRGTVAAAADIADTDVLTVLTADTLVGTFSPDSEILFEPNGAIVLRPQYTTSEVNLSREVAANGHFYALTLEPLSWLDAEAAAVVLGGHLVDITRLAEQRFVQSNFPDAYWIGLNDIAEEGTYVWSTGVPAVFTNWNTGEPNNNGEEDAAHIDSNGFWNDTSVNDLRFGIMEFESAPTGFEGEVFQWTEADNVPNAESEPTDESVHDAPPVSTTSPAPILAVATSPSPEAEPDAPAAPVTTGQPREYTYDPVFSQLTSETDELGRLTLYTIDPANGNTLSVRHVVGQLDTVGGESDDQLIQYTYTALGLVDTMTDPLGRVTDWDYDTFGRVVRVTLAKGTADEAVSRIEYDSHGNVSTTIDANGHRTEYQYDMRDRLTLLRDAAGNETQFRYDPFGNLFERVDARGNMWHYVYDKRNRLIETEDQQHNVTRYQYDRAGNLVRAVDPLGHTTRYEYDARDRRVKAIDPDGGVTTFGYDLDGNMTSLTDPVGNTTHFTYDARGRQISEIDPLGKEIKYEYDAVDNVIRKTDRLMRVTEYAYDDLDRLVKETWGGDSTGSASATLNTFEYQYDLANNLLHIQDVFSELTETYDAQDRMTTVDNGGTPEAPHVVLSYTYDPASNVTSVTDAIEGQPGAATGYEYDALDRLATLTQTAAPGATGSASVPLPSDKRVDFTYNSLSQYEHIRRYSDLSATSLVIDTAYAYDTVNRLQSIDHRNSAGSAVSFFHYQYDAASRISQITDIDGVTDYGYDNRDQLTGADHSPVVSSLPTAPPDETYVYDANGNRISSSLHGSGYVTGPANRLLSDGTYNYEYDAEGNTILRTEITTGDVREFRWDYRNRLTAVIDKNVSGTKTQEVRFTYDALDRRIAKLFDGNPADAIDAVVTNFVYDREDVVLDFVDGDGMGAQPSVLAERYLHGPGIDQVLAQDGGADKLEWHLTDHLGTVRDLVDDNAHVFNHVLYDSYGNVLSEAHLEVDTRYLYVGRESDRDVALQHFRARYYSEVTGRFISEDPIRAAGSGTNLAQFVRNSPTMLLDPFGRECTEFTDDPRTNDLINEALLKANFDLVQAWQYLKELRKNEDESIANYQPLVNAEHFMMGANKAYISMKKGHTKSYTTFAGYLGVEVYGYGKYVKLDKFIYNQEYPSSNPSASGRASGRRGIDYGITRYQQEYKAKEE